MNIDDSQVEYIVNSWDQLNSWQKNRLYVRCMIMSGNRIIKAIALGIIGSLITAISIALVSGVAGVQDLWWLVLGVFAGIVLGYILGVRSS